ncbi:MAG: hypothetical protein GEU81_17020 [Nitriliruptorales bacterium]|nr:hypothetical protein [Nitriliruptorales bacterium]
MSTLLVIAAFTLLASACDLAALNLRSPNPIEADPVAAAPAGFPDPEEAPEEEPADDPDSDDASNDHGSSNDHDHGSSSDDSSSDDDGEPATSEPSAGSIALAGNEVDNIRPDPVNPSICEDSSLPNGAGLADKSGTCVPTQLGEVAPNPVRVTVRNPPDVVAEGDDFTMNILVADRDGGLDLNAFTFDASGGAGVTFLEQGGELDENARPLMHCHLGVAGLEGPNALPGETFDAAFLGLQGVNGDFEATVSGLPAGFYRGVIYCSGPGHAALSTGEATDMQAVQTFDFEVAGDSGDNGDNG